MTTIPARTVLRWFNVDAPSLTEEGCDLLVAYADCQERPSLARLDVLRAMWRKLGVDPKP